MIEVDTSGVEAFCKALDAEWAAFEAAISLRYANWTRKVFIGMVTLSPQWSGDMAANWNYSIGKIDTFYSRMPMKDQDWDKTTAKKRGDMEAVQMALEVMEIGRMPHWRETVYISNPTPIAPSVEAHTVKIRPVNLVDGRVAMVKYTLDHPERYRP